MRIVNKARGDYSYKLSPTSPIITSTTYSNDAITIVLPSILTVEKSVDKKSATLYDVLTYTTTITNLSNYTIKNIFFQDIISPYLKFIINTLKVNGKTLFCIDPNTPIPIGDILPDGKIVITFDVLVAQIPPNNTIENQSIISFDYIYNVSANPYNVVINSNIVYTLVENILFKQFSASSTFRLPVDCNHEIKLLKIIPKIEIVKTKLVSTPVMNTITYKDNLLCNLILVAKIHYHIIYKYKYRLLKKFSVFYTDGFSTSILVPCGTTLNPITPNNIDIEFEKTSYYISCENTIFINSMLFLKILPNTNT